MATFKTPARLDKISDHIIRQIMDQVASGILKPGDKVGSEKELIGQLGVSKASVREALRVLEIMGIITIKKGIAGGAFIASVDMKATLISIMNFISFEAVTIKDITQVRYFFEPFVLELAFPLITGEDLNQLRETSEKEIYRAKMGQAERGFGFHRYIVRLTRNPILIIIADYLDNLLTDLEIKARIGDEFFNAVQDWHSVIIEKLQNKDLPGAIEALIYDVLAGSNYMADKLNEPRFDPDKALYKYHNTQRVIALSQKPASMRIAKQKT